MRRIFSTLAFKITSVIVAIQIAALLGLGYFMADYRMRMELRRARVQIVLPAQLLSQGLLLPRQVTDRDALERLLGVAVREAYLVDSAGMVGMAGDSSVNGRAYQHVPGAAPALLRFAREINQPCVELSRSNREFIILAPVSVTGTAWRFLHLRTDSNRVLADRNRIMMAALWGSLFYIVLTAVVLGYMVHRLLMPRIKATTALLEQAEHGQLNMRIDNAVSSDEIGELQRNVNKMVAGIDRQTAQLKAQKSALESSEARFKELADMLPQTVFECSLDGRFTFVNRQGYQTFKYTPEDVAKGVYAPQIIASWDRERAIDNMRRVAQTNDSDGNEYTVVCKDGSMLPTVVYSSAVLRDGVPVGLRGIIIDQSERRRAEQERVALQEQLQMSEKLQAIGQLAGGIAHDFNNQLTGIIGCAELVREEVRERPELTADVDTIVTAARRAAELTSQLLAFARKGKYLSAPVDLHTTIAEVVRLLGRSIEKKIQIRTDLGARRPVVMGDSTQLQNALLNLALNARDAMPTGGNLTFATSDVELAAEHAALLPGDVAPGPYVRVCVIDTGVGMDSELRKRIFEPFFTTKEPGRGTGMGLPAVYGTVSNHKGTIDVTSERGEGSTFSLYLPLAPTGVATAPVAVNAPPARLPEGMCVMVVDDEETVLRTATGVLHAAGCTVIACRSGAEAVERYRGEWRTIAAVLLDMIMPGMDGRETFAALRAINPAVAAVLTSGYSLEGDAQQILQEGVRVFVQKPYRPDDLVRAVASVAVHASAADA